MEKIWFTALLGYMCWGIFGTVYYLFAHSFYTPQHTFSITQLVFALFTLVAGSLLIGFTVILIWRFLSWGLKELLRYRG